MYRISVTTLEKFRRFMSEASPFDTEESLLESIKGLFTGNPKTAFGTAYHSLLEGQYRPNGNGMVWAKGYCFTQQQAAPALLYRSEHTAIVSEVTVSKIYETNLFPIQVSGRVDALEGLFIRDSKTKFRQLDCHEYIDSCQWKFYCDMLQADTFYYDVFEVKGFPDDATMELKMFPDVRVEAVQSIQCIRYDGLYADIRVILDDFLAYVANRNLWQYLKPALITESILD